MPDFTVYDVETGRVINSGTVGSLKQVAIQSGTNTEIVLGQMLDAETTYVVLHEPTPRPKFTPVEHRTIRADGVHTTTISNVPPGTALRLFKPDKTIDDYTIDDGSFAFSTAIAGVYRFKFRGPWPYREQTMTVVADAP